MSGTIRKVVAYPETRGREGSLGLRLDTSLELRVSLANSLHDGRELLSSHYTNASVGPHPQEAWAVGTPAHAVVSGTIGTANNNGEFRNICASNGSDELGTVLGNTITLRGGADHEAGDVLQEDKRDTTLRAELNEMGSFDGGRGKQDAVVGDDADLVAVNGGKAGHKSGTEVTLELGELGAINDTSNDFSNGDRLPQVGGGNTEELLRVIEGFGKGLGRRLSGSRLCRPIEVANRPPGECDGVGIIDGQIVRDTRDGRVHLSTTELLSADDFSSGSLDQRRTSQEDVALLLHNDGLVTHGRDVSTAGGARTHDNGDLGDALGAHAGLVVEDATEVLAVGEDVGLMREVGTTAVNEIDAAVYPTIVSSDWVSIDPGRCIE